MTELVTLTLTSPLTWAAPVAGAVSAAENSSPEQASIRTADSAGQVSGEIVAFNVDCHPMGPYETVRFAPGCLAPPHQVGRVKLLRDHDAGAPLGVMTSLEADQHGARAAFRLGRHPAAIEAAGLVEDQILDGLSVGIIPVKVRDEGGTTVIVTAALREVSLVTIPAIDSSRASIGAGAPPQREEVKAMTAPAPAPPT
uniref:HK97 family phage prohead protease n=1 Tax=Catenulispora pinisilvae TaxID=2705253 RepID=UPI0018917A0E